MELMPDLPVAVPLIERDYRWGTGIRIQPDAGEVLLLCQSVGTSDELAPQSMPLPVRMNTEPVKDQRLPLTILPGGIGIARRLAIVHTRGSDTDTVLPDNIERPRTRILGDAL